MPDETDAVARKIVEAAFEIHSTLGPGLLESGYERCLLKELRIRGIRPQSQVGICALVFMPSLKTRSNTSTFYSRLAS
jgi:GxxExxY protein